VLRDEDVIADAREAAEHVVQGDPALERHTQLAGLVDELVRSEQASYLERS
jgi:ATP-dependent DNA helicase RecG